MKTAELFDMALPFPRSYWVRYGQLLGGCYPGDKDPRVAEQKMLGLLDAGVSCVVNLMESDETDHAGGKFVAYEEKLQALALLRGREVACRRFPIVDQSTPTISQMEEILDFIDAALSRNEVLYFHCWGGRGRTGTVAGCHFVRHGEALGEAVFSLLASRTSHGRQIFGRLPERECQRDFVRNWSRFQ